MCQKHVPEPPGAALFCLEPPSALGPRGRTEPETPKKMSAPQHCMVVMQGLKGVMGYEYSVLQLLNGIFFDEVQKWGQGDFCS